METLFVRREPAALGSAGAQISVAGLKIHHKVPPDRSQPDASSRPAADDSASQRAPPITHP